MSTPGVRATLSVSLAALLTGDAVAGGDEARFRVDYDKQMDWEPGNIDSVAKADVLYSGRVTIAASGNQDFDLFGALTSALGAAVNASRVVAVVIEAASTNTNAVRFGPAASAGALGPFADATDRLVIQPGNVMVLTCRQGWTITGTTADKWNFANSAAGSSVTFNIYLIGRTAPAP